ncbi:MAM domain-containing glycosylphosphatidylinositol anchor protein 1 [Varanus komodoensis]|nr:MAM domain-containing glycosylphosphatidylinositol anchor protein 1 [Varanus komodoensis]
MVPVLPFPAWSLMLMGKAFPVDFCFVRLLTKSPNIYSRGWETHWEYVGGGTGECRAQKESLNIISPAPISTRGRFPWIGAPSMILAPAQAQIIHAGQACVVKEDNISERVYTIREGDILVLQCLVTGHPRPQVRWTKTAGSASDKFQETSVFNETLRIEKIQRLQGGRYYCKAENGVGVPAIKSIRVDVQ